MKNIRLYPMFSAGLLLVITLAACSLGGQSVVITGPQEGIGDGSQSTPAIVIVPVTGDTPIAAQPTITPLPTIAHLVQPGEPTGGSLSEITDRDTSIVAAEKRAVGGENFNADLFERPFNAETMDKYFPDLDITRARLSYDTQWVYITIRLSGLGDGGILGGNYGVEVDLDVDGRGDFLVFANAPGASWSVEGVRVWADLNNDVGSSQPIYGNAPITGDGYETLSFDSGIGTDPDLAWARLDPGDSTSAQLAFKISLLNADYKFTWGAWAEGSAFNPVWFDYNDYFTLAQAGSPLIESADYPVKSLSEVDNTCRWVVGFTPTGTELGLCSVPATPVPVLPGTVSGVVFQDGTNGDLVLDGASGRIAGATVRARSGDCSSPGGVVATALTNSLGAYTLTLPAGTYCIDVSPDPVGYSYKTLPQTVNVSNGSSLNNVNFGYSWYLG